MWSSQEPDRVNAHLAPVAGKFLVGSVPCMLKFEFDNEYSWMREKIISYRITVSPPAVETLMAGRRRRAKACEKAVADDLESGKTRLENTQTQRTSLEKEILALEKDLEEKKKAMEAVTKEETWLQGRVDLRKQQQDLLLERLKNGWVDEKTSEEETESSA